MSNRARSQQESLGGGMTEKVWEYPGMDMPGLQGLLVPLMQGRVKLSKPTMRRLEKELAKREKRRLRREAPLCRKPGFRSHLRKLWREGRLWKKECNPYLERGTKRRYNRFIKRAREKGIECTITLEEWNKLFENVKPSDSVGVFRLDSTKGFTIDNVVLKHNYAQFAGKLTHLRRKLKQQRKLDTAQAVAAEP
jgi:hypothetical protein